MGQMISMAMTYCCMTAAGSLCQSCFGSTAEGTTGRKRSVLLLGLTVAIALWFQYSIGPSIVSESGWMWSVYKKVGMGKMMYRGWHDPCQAAYASTYGNDTPMDVLEKCAGNAGVFRPTFVSTLYFIGAAIATAAVPSLNREAWPAKYTIFLFAVLITMFLPSSPIFSGFFVWIARLGAAAFVVLQQIILIDVAYNWNDDWVERSNAADRVAYGTGGAWLQAIVGTCVGMYSATIIAIVLLYQHFGHCSDNTWIITLTLLAVVAMTAIQLSGTEGSLLTSSVLSLYTAYLAFSIVSKNPNPTCNPRLGHEDFWGIFVGLFLTVVSLIWTGFSYSAEIRLSVDSVQSPKAVVQPASSDIDGGGSNVNLDVPFLNDDERPTAGLVTQGTGEDPATTPVSSNVWKLNVVMALISCYVAMILTGWGTVDGMFNDGPNAANPTIGRVNMAIIGVSQWLAIGLYTWTLLAPRLFPDRDFS